MALSSTAPSPGADNRVETCGNCRPERRSRSGEVRRWTSRSASRSFCRGRIAHETFQLERRRRFEEFEPLVDVMLADDRINFSFAVTDLTKFKKLLYDQLCEITDGLD